MNISPFPILEFRTHKLDLKSYEKKLGFSFPPVYGSFISNFKPELKGHYVYVPRTSHEKKFIDSDYRKISIIAYSSENQGELTAEDDELAFMSFKSMESMLTFCVPDEAGMEDLIFISDHGTSDALLLGIGIENKDKIFLYSEIREETVSLIAENIFDFLGSCQVVESHLDKQYYGSIREVITTNLYKKWGEDFWRIREEVEST